jgi:nitroimidazol reductase NimA-like FMN-containing flavoprotein (pyridoxamine 5'-phosphate oxidase superfamily)
MSEATIEAEILQYILDSKHAVLTYVRGDLAPVSRAMGSFAPDGSDLFFSTGKDSAKVGEIERNKTVSFYFEHDNQAAQAWKSVLLIGEARQVHSGEKGYDSAIQSLSAKSPRFRERVAKGDLGNAAIYKVTAAEVEFLDRSKGYGPPQRLLIP